MAKLPGVQEKIVTTNNERYGGPSPFCSQDVRDKATERFRADYGHDFYLQSEDWKAKMLERFGTEQPFDSQEFKDMAKNITSEGERQVCAYIESLGVSTRKMRKDHLELDVYVEEKALGFEFNGLYWHSDRNKADNYHFQKMQHFKALGIDTIFIYENEWRQRQAQVMSRIRAILGKNENRVAIRKCRIDIIDRKTANAFLEKYHIQGGVRSIRRAYGVYLEDQLLSVVTFGRHHRDSRKLVLNRFVTKESWTVLGSLGKISKLASKHFKCDITSWCDLRWSQGKGYYASGWILGKQLKPDYCYITKNFRNLIGKQSRKKDLIKTPDGVTEREHAKLEGLSRIYDCGKLAFLYLYKK